MRRFFPAGTKALSTFGFRVYRVLRVSRSTPTCIIPTKPGKGIANRGPGEKCPTKHRSILFFRVCGSEALDPDSTKTHQVLLGRSKQWNSSVSGDKTRNGEWFLMPKTLAGE